MTPTETDWHLRAHDQMESRMASLEDEVRSGNASLVKELNKLQTMLTEIRTERRVAKATGSYLIPAGVSLVVAYMVKRFGLL